MNIRGTWYFSPGGDSGYNENFRLTFGNTYVHYTFPGWKHSVNASWKGVTGRLYLYTIYDSYHECGPHTYRTKFSETKVCFNMPRTPGFRLVTDGTDDVDSLPDSYFRQIDENTLKFNFREDISDDTCLIFVRPEQVEQSASVIWNHPLFYSRLGIPEKPPERRECSGDIDST